MMKSMLFVSSAVNKRTTYVDPRLALSISDKKKGKWKFDSSSTAMEVLRGQDLSNKTAIITGANSGIGKSVTCSR